jgi:hypothetical protein
MADKVGSRNPARSRCWHRWHCRRCSRCRRLFAPPHVLQIRPSPTSHYHLSYSALALASAVGVSSSKELQLLWRVACSGRG